MVASVIMVVIMDPGQNRETEINKIPKDHPAPSTSSVQRKTDDDDSDHLQLSSPETKRVRKKLCSSVHLKQQQFISTQRQNKDG
ncbi:hypothetical protein EYF80_021872 [Liparis tanakae]|uniref:Uncharacterized protein n=1 Tax=Liparis tanakae TaxID=230148 RepID=A0A4Z2HSE7_9TELE|nr:hypothetical protein EYF80_021872 [Liparis tanakae]